MDYSDIAIKCAAAVAVAMVTAIMAGLGAAGKWVWSSIRKMLKDNDAAHAKIRQLEKRLAEVEGKGEF